MARVMISAAHKSSGKTTVTLGIAAALRARGRRVQPFKKGPDFIDPLWLSVAAGRPCRNLDHHTLSEPELAALFARHAATADLSVIEGNKGLHDGVALDGRDSGAALAKLLAVPVVLVVDCSGITRGIAPLLVGYRRFDPAVALAGVILNKVAGPRHEAKLRRAVEAYTDLAVVGAVARTPALAITERHLGLTPANELPEAEERIAAIAAVIRDAVDLDRLEAIAHAAASLGAPPVPAAETGHVAPDAGPRRRVGIARDRAFGFYYPDDLEGLEAAGLELVPVDTLNDPALPPDLDGLFLGGGFPETHLDALEANRSLRAEIRRAVAAGLPVYAECGGLMYLSRSLARDGRRAEMVGAIDADAVIEPRPQGKGYVVLSETADAPWPGGGVGTTTPAHEFHYGRLENLGPQTRFAYQVARGHGITGRDDGIVTANTLASFSHLRGVGARPWPDRFAAFVRRTADARPTRP